MNQLVVRPLQSFFGHKLLFVQLFPRTKTGILHLDIHIRFQTGQTDEVACQRIYFYRLTHIQHKDFAAVGVAAGLKHQADRLRNGHEITNDVRMGDGNRAAGKNLFLEQRNHGSVASQHIAEPYCNEFRLALAKLFILLRRRCPFFENRIAEHLRCFIRFARLHQMVEGLHNHLAQSLGGAHDVARVYRFVRTDQHKFIDVMNHCRKCGIVGTDDIVFNRFARTDLHQRYVFVGRSMEYDIRVILLEHLENSSVISNRTD